jgi:archaellum component FlaG (FlaF/FlaG flagellin family)
METTMLMILMASALLVLAIIVGVLVIHLLHKSDELKEKNDVIVREVRRNQQLIDRAVQLGVNRAAMIPVIALLCMLAQIFGR